MRWVPSAPCWQNPRFCWPLPASAVPAHSCLQLPIKGLNSREGITLEEDYHETYGEGQDRGQENVTMIHRPALRHALPVFRPKVGGVGFPISPERSLSRQQDYALFLSHCSVPAVCCTVSALRCEFFRATPRSNCCAARETVCGVRKASNGEMISESSIAMSQQIRKI